MVKTYPPPITNILLLLATLVPHVGAQAAAGFLGHGSSSSLSAPLTCASTRLNHVTQTLPQQCFTAPWAEKPRGHTVTEERIHNGSSRSSCSASNATPTASATIHNHSISPSTAELANPQPRESSVSKASTDTPTPSTQETLDQSADGESESPLDNAHFLSFEEWKKRNLAKAGQSPDDHGGARSEAADISRRPGAINNALDSLGDDTEIEIDFAGFVNPQVVAPRAPHAQQGFAQGTEAPSAEEDTKKPNVRLTSTHPKSKDAGVTCKERSNYASFDCAATMLKTNPECKSATSILVENKDSYMLNECLAKNKFLIVELCNDILVDTVVLANFEFFSSIFRTFRVSVSDRYPVKLDKWRDLGTFEARNSRGIQAFLIEEPQIWARYLRIEFLTHYGHEYYCPVSLLRVHGTTMMEEFNHELKNSRGDDDVEGEAEDEEAPQESRSLHGVVSAEALKQQATMSSRQSASVESPAAHYSATPTLFEHENSNQVRLEQISDAANALKAMCPFSNRPSAELEAVLTTANNEKRACKWNETSAGTSTVSQVAPISGNPSISEASPALGTSSVADATTSVPATLALAHDHTSAVSSSATTASDTESKIENSTSGPSKVSHQGSQPSSRNHASPTQPSAPNPTTQESFFKSVYKRLQLLESNSTLSLGYIEDQSRILRDAFAKVEKRQLAKATAFLEALNATVLNEVREFRNQYDQIWQSTVLELSSQRHQSQLEIAALSTRLTLLADELLFQKRIAILQFLLILLCLGLALFSRGSAAAAGATYLEHVVNKSSINLSRYASGFDSPPGSPSSTRPPSRYGFFSRARSWDHRRSPSEESMGMQMGERDATKSPSIEFEPATPTSMRSEDEGTPRSDGVSGGGDGARDMNGANGLLSPEDRPESSSSSGTSHSVEVGQSSS
ncbi:MAG: hypothetical protein Q9192_000661 [Flavoplaca navasiana]